MGVCPISAKVIIRCLEDCWEVVLTLVRTQALLWVMLAVSTTVSAVNPRRTGVPLAGLPTVGRQGSCSDQASESLRSPFRLRLTDLAHRTSAAWNMRARTRGGLVLRSRIAQGWLGGEGAAAGWAPRGGRCTAAGIGSLFVAGTPLDGRIDVETLLF